MKAFDTLPSLTGPTPTAGHVCGCSGWRRGLARKPRKEEYGDDEPTKSEHGELRGTIQQIAMANDASSRPKFRQSAHERLQVVDLSGDRQIARFMMRSGASGEIATRMRSRVAIRQQGCREATPGNRRFRSRRFASEGRLS
jgi:hypothetical protein